MNSMTNEKRRRGKQKEPTLVHLSLRLPQEVVAYFKAQPNYTQEIRRVLSDHVEDKVGIPTFEKTSEKDGDR